MKSIRIGTGAGFAGDRIDNAVNLALHGDIDYLILEGLAERTTIQAHLERLSDPQKGYGQFLEERMKTLLPICKEKNITIITNLGAANPNQAAKITEEIAETLNLQISISIVTQPLLRNVVQNYNPTLWETNEPLSMSRNEFISADAYLGAEEMLPALHNRPDVVITGRVADPSLFLAPMIHEFNWKLDDWDLLGKGTVIGHLLECGAQVTGGYFADGVTKQVNQLATVGMPIAEISSNGEATISKTPNSGGEVSIRTCKEQLLYEVMDPATYLTPDVCADFSQVTFTEVAKDIIKVDGATGRKRPDDFKLTIGIDQGFIGEAMINYVGYAAFERAKLAKSIVVERLLAHGLEANAIHTELLGAYQTTHPSEVLLRVAVKSPNHDTVGLVGYEVEALWLNGPGGPGGVRKSIRPVLSAYSATIPRSLITNLREDDEHDTTL
ncbi:ABC transporter substrate-binding protein [Bacillaceae bacterium JMAK1]|nr:ABC transporter substrate-binding protein [Bacillaceae bacterium JMAK1]